MRWPNINIINFIYHKLFDQCPNPAYWIDRKGQYLGCNQQYKQLLQIPLKSKLIGLNVNQYLENLAIRVEYTNQSSKKCKSLQKTYYFGTQAHKTFQVTQFSCFGVTFFLEENLQFHIKRLRDLEQKYAVLKHKSDKTKAYLNNLIQIVPASVYWKDTHSIILGGNLAHAKLAGFSRPEDVIGKTEFDFVWRNQAEDIIENDQKIMTSGEGLKLEEIATLSDGAIHTFLTSKEPLRDKNGKVIGIIGISLDITELKKLQDDLRKAKEAAEVANRAKTEFIANMSHDIRTPLTGVLGMAQILEDTLVDPKQKQYAQWLGDSGGQLLKMLNEVLDAISADSVHENQATEEAFNLSELIYSIVELELPSIIVKKIELLTDITPNLPPILIGDKKKIYHILLNLLSNAVKFTKVGHVKIEVYPIKKDPKTILLQFDVSDTGIGIPYDAQDKVFDRFFHVKPSYKGIYEGRGLGLHIVKSYIESLGGKITVESIPDVGTKFSFQLLTKIGHPNLLPSPTQDASITEKKPFSSQTLSKMPHILIVEDNTIALTIVESIVHQAKLTSSSATDGESALELAKTHSFDLIMTDIGLPGISGCDFTEQFRAWEKSQNKNPIPIVGLTAHAEHTIRNKCLLSGMNDIYCKPLTLCALEMIISKFFCKSILQELTQCTDSPNNQNPIDDLHLPTKEKQLFQLDHFPLLNKESALINLGSNKTLLINMLKEFIAHAMPADRKILEAAFKKKDWDKIEELTHKIKGGAVYLGLDRMQYACQYLERYHKAGHTKLLVQLYEQFMRIFGETLHMIEEWLELEQTPS
ncbi:MAG: hybrid sensor histidine kinase/response regulator [Legionella sp.]|nr:MAG: hybrid sensor histidine kinase/response regulator [Legionella sp.]